MDAAGITVNRSGLHSGIIYGLVVTKVGCFENEENAIGYGFQESLKLHLDEK